MRRVLKVLYFLYHVARACNPVDVTPPKIRWTWADCWEMADRDVNQI